MGASHTFVIILSGLYISVNPKIKPCLLHLASVSASSGAAFAKSNLRRSSHRGGAEFRVCLTVGCDALVRYDVGQLWASLMYIHGFMTQCPAMTG